MCSALSSARGLKNEVYSCVARFLRDKEESCNKPVVFNFFCA